MCADRISLVLILMAVANSGQGQKLPSLQNLPTLDVFLSWLLDVTSNEVDNLVNNFDFHAVSPGDIRFLLHVSGDNTTKLTALNAHSLINPNQSTKFIIHGWQASGEPVEEANRKFLEEYRKKGNYNVIAVDWTEHSRKVYMHASSSTKDTGNVIGDFILDLTKKDPQMLKKVHLIGHSLGGHVAGFAGKRVFKKSGHKVGRITGLDVAAPLFEIPRKREKDSKLDREDAEFVDVIHTNIGFLGMTEAIGTADFYVENGGPLQPGCFDILNIFESFACSHYKAFEYFRESINQKQFEALSCPNSIDYHILMCVNNRRVRMGEDIPRNASGTFYLETESPLPYSKLFENQLRIRINRPRFFQSGP